MIRLRLGMEQRTRPGQQILREQVLGLLQVQLRVQLRILPRLLLVQVLVSIPVLFGVLFL